MLQIRKCTWQSKCCGKALKTQDFRRICKQPCWILSSLLLISHCVFLKLSSFITSLPELPFLSISDCNYSWICWREKTEGKRWDEMNSNSFKFQKEDGRKGKTLQLAVITSVCFPQPPAPCSVTFFSPFMGRLGLLIQTSDPLRQPFVATHREKEMRKKRDGAKHWEGGEGRGTKWKSSGRAMQEKRWE